jgi:SAM-dependent methyltransferase
VRPPQTHFYGPDAPLPTAESRAGQAAKIRALLERTARQPLGQLTCLEIGCSSGLITRELAPLFARTLALEYDWSSLRNARPPPGHEVHFLRGDGMALPLPDASVDLVLCSQVYEHVPDDRRLFAEIWRVMAPGGQVFFSGPNWLYPIEPHFFLPFLHWLPGRLADAWLRSRGGPDHYYERSRTWWGLQRELRRFEIIDLTRDVVRDRLAGSTAWWAGPLRAVPGPLWALLGPLLPNFNWVLFKPDRG